MNLQPVMCNFSDQSSTAFNVLLKCLKCGKNKKPFQMLADLDGVAFVAYYCRDCNEPYLSFPNDLAEKLRSVDKIFEIQKDKINELVHLLGKVN